MTLLRDGHCRAAGFAIGVLFAILVLRSPAAWSQGLLGRKQGPAVQVLTFYPGMPAATMEKTITNRIERWVNQAPGVARIESHTIAGVSIVRVHFRNDVKSEDALTTTSSLAIGTLPTLPPSTLPPIVLPWNPDNSRPAALLLVANPAMSGAQLRDLARVDVRNLLGTVPGCVAPVVLGGKDRTVVIHLDRRRLEARKLSCLDVVKALQAANLLGTHSTCFGTDQVLVFDIGPVRDKLKELNDLSIRDEPGVPVLLRDVGRAEEAAAVQTSRVRVNGRQDVVIQLFAQEGMNPNALRERLTKAVPDMEQRLPKGTKLALLPLDIPRKGGAKGGNGLITIRLRAPSGMGLDDSEKRIAEVERLLKDSIPAVEREGIVSVLGVNPDFSAAYTHNDGPQDTTIYVQLSAGRTKTAREYSDHLRGLLHRKNFADLQAVINSDDLPPAITVHVSGGTAEKAEELARQVRDRLARIQGTADIHVVQRMDSPYLIIEVDRQKAADVGLSAQNVILQVMAALDAPIPFPISRNFWIDAKSSNPYFVSVPYSGKPDRKLEDLLDQPATGTEPQKKVKLSSLATLRRRTGPVEIDHVGLTRVFTVRANVEGRGLREVLAEVKKALDEIAVPKGMRLELK
jgi:multidrug efflux pump subunit AcrB